MKPPAPARVGHLDRRRVLSAAIVAGVLPLTACDDVLLESSTGAGGPADGPAADPDEQLLSDAVTAEQQALDALRALVDAAPTALRSLLVATVRVHEAHLELLDGGGGEAAPGQSVPRGQVRRRLRQVAVLEQGLARRHAASAVRATSGQFARVLAGMSAASAQQADVWRQRGGSGG